MKRIADKRLVVDIETTLDHKTIWLSGIYRGRYVTDRTQPNQFRCVSPQQLMEDEDSIEQMLRHSAGFSTTQPKPRRGPQPRRLGQHVTHPED
jgi:hypothetical protein